jgi:predicted TIM-barrel fold metal-dependent hydrolase
MEKLAIVSTDGHAGPLVDAYRDSLDPKYHEDLDRLIDEEHEFLAITSKIGAFSNTQLEVIDEDGAIASGGLTGAWDLERRIQEMDREGIAAEVFLQGHQCASPPFFGPQNRYYPAELRLAGVRAFNRWQADMLRHANGRLIGIAEQTPVPDLGEIVAEVRWAGENGFRGVAFPAVTDPEVPQPSYADSYWEPLWRVCAEYDMALVMHVGLGSPQGSTYALFQERAKSMADTQGDYDRNARAADTANMMEMAQDPKLKNLFALGYSPRQVFWELAVGGVFDRFPTLKYVPTEARADWLPSTLAHLDARFDRGDTPLKRRPSDYWTEHGFAGASFIHRAELVDRHAIGVRTLMFGRDYPHPEGTWPNTKDWLRAAFVGVPESEARLILGENAIRCYGLDAAAVKLVAAQVGPSVDEILGEHQEVNPRMLNEFDKRGGFAKAAPALLTEALDEIIERTLVDAARAG